MRYTIYITSEKERLKTIIHNITHNCGIKMFYNFVFFKLCTILHLYMFIIICFYRCDEREKIVLLLSFSISVCNNC